MLACITEWSHYQEWPLPVLRIRITLMRIRILWCGCRCEWVSPNSTRSEMWPDGMWGWRPTTKSESQLEVRNGRMGCEDEDLPPRVSPNSTRSEKWSDGMWGWRPTTKSESQLEVRNGRMGCEDEDLPPRVSPNSTRSEKWSDGMWGCGQPMILLSFSHSSDIGPRIPEHKKIK